MLGNHQRTGSSGNKKPFIISICLVFGFEVAICAYLYHSKSLDPNFFVPFCIILFVITLLPILHSLLSDSQFKVNLPKRIVSVLRFFASYFFLLIIVPLIMGGATIILTLLPLFRELRGAIFFTILIIGNILYFGSKTILKSTGSSGEVPETHT